MAQAFTVLLFDDDHLVRDTIVGIIEAKGIRVLAAENAVQAMHILAQEHVDVLFTDIVMPDQNGLELATQAKKPRPNLQIMFATGYFSRAAAASQLGKLLFKPMRAHEIEAALDEALPMSANRLADGSCDLQLFHSTRGAELPAPSLRAAFMLVALTAACLYPGPRFHASKIF
jgi:DNA-binding NtrC family response regulator